MAFQPVNFARLARFNSSSSSDLIDIYENEVRRQIAEKNAEPKHQTFAPSSFRCPRYSWFRLRGVKPDVVKAPDLTLQFTADVGTACHENIQRHLSIALGDDWIDVGEYLKTAWGDKGIEYSIEKHGFETRVALNDPPMRFACDGIVRIKGQLYLLEIKTSDFASFDELTNPKSQHIDQIKCYATKLGLDKVLVLYQDRQYGGVKCYEIQITEADKRMINDRFKYVQDCVQSNIAPDRLDWSDRWCSPSMCPYHRKCKEWG